MICSGSIPLRVVAAFVLFRLEEAEELAERFDEVRGILHMLFELNYDFTPGEDSYNINRSLLPGMGDLNFRSHSRSHAVQNCFKIAVFTAGEQIMTEVLTDGMNFDSHFDSHYIQNVLKMF